MAVPVVLHGSRELLPWADLLQEFRPDWDALVNVYNGLLQRLDSRAELNDLGNGLINMSTMAIAPNL